MAKKTKRKKKGIDLGKSLKKIAKGPKKPKGKKKSNHEPEVIAMVVFFLFSAYILLLTNTGVATTAMATGSVSFAPPPTTAQLTTGTNAYSIILMFIMSLAFLIPAEIWIRNHKK